MNAETIAMATIVAGVIGVPLVNGVKKLFELTGYKLEARPALYVTLAISIILGVVVLWLSGAFNGPLSLEMVGGVIASIFAVATIVYKTITQSPEPDQGGEVLRQ